MPFTVVFFGVTVDSLKPTAFSAAPEPFMLIAVPFVVFSDMPSSFAVRVACMPDIPASFIAFSSASAFSFAEFDAGVAAKFIFLPFITRSSPPRVSAPLSTGFELRT